MKTNGRRKAQDAGSKPQNPSGAGARNGCSVTLLKKVYIAAPLAGDVAGNIEKVKEYARYAFECGVTPMIPHFYALTLNDANPAERELGLKAGRSLIWAVDEVWCFGDAVTPGMKDELALARQLNITVRFFRAKQKLLGGTQFYETKKGF
jgi:hypothetical protein